MNNHIPRIYAFVIHLRKAYFFGRIGKYYIQIGEILDWVMKLSFKLVKRIDEWKFN